MSDPVTNVELDDVLSSIRRLVADRDPSSRPAAPVAADGAPQAAQGADPLLLTPALRVEADPVPRGPTLVFPPRPVVIAHDPLPESGLVARLAAKLEAAVTKEAAEFEPDGSEDDPVIDWSAPMLGDPPIFRSRQMAGQAPAPAAGPVRMILPLPEGADNSTQAPLRDAIEAAAPVVAPPVAQSAEPEPAFHHRGVAAVPPVDAADDLIADLTDAADVAAAPGLTLADGQVLDSDMLCSLIADVVRQELQGELGERITRNVRKLVRREIFKVLSSQDLE